jgi:alpha-tubulin suppressor-like RCC1 family protein
MGARLLWCLVLAAGLWACSDGGTSEPGGGGVPFTGGTTGDGGDEPSGDDVPTSTPRRLSLGTLGSCVVYDDSRMWCWGWNQNGQFGTGRDSQFETPTHVYELGPVEVMALAGDFGCAATVGGGVECMGYDHGGTDQAVALDDAAVGLAVGSGHACALLDGGGVACWGQNSSGQLGDGTQQGRVDPAPVTGLAGVDAVAGEHDRTCALAGGELWCWGAQLGSAGTWLEPQRVDGLSGVDAVSLGGDQTCVVRGDELWCWGNGACDALGRAGDCEVPFRVVEVGVPVDEVVALDGATCARSGGDVWCWGRNYRGQLGDGTREEHVAPAVVEGLPDVTALGGGDDHVCAATADDHVWCWGGNGNGKIGNGTTIDQLTPVQVL